MIAQDSFRVGVLGAFSRGARGGNPSQEKRRKHSRRLWCSEHVRAHGKKTSEGAAALSVSGANVKNGTYLIEMK